MDYSRFPEWKNKLRFTSLIRQKTLEENLQRRSWSDFSQRRASTSFPVTAMNFKSSSPVLKHSKIKFRLRNSELERGNQNGSLLDLRTKCNLISLLFAPGIFKVLSKIIHIIPTHAVYNILYQFEFVSLFYNIFFPNSLYLCLCVFRLLKFHVLAGKESAATYSRILAKYI